MRPVQQTQIPFWPQQHQGSAVWTHSRQTQPWQTPRWPFELTYQKMQALRGLASSVWQSSGSPPVPPRVPPPASPPPTWNATQAGFASVDASRQDKWKKGWNLNGTGYPGVGQPTIQITDRDPCPKGTFRNQVPAKDLGCVSSVVGDMTPARLCTTMESNCASHFRWDSWSQLG